MGKPTVVRLFPLANEHALPILLDLAYIGVVLVVLAVGFGVSPAGGWAFLLLLSAAGFHLALVYWLVKVVFSDEGITIVRPWRRIHVPWSEVSGLIYSNETSPTPGRDAYRLRLVRKGNEPPIGRFITQAEAARSADGPVVMTVFDPAAALDRPGAAGRCEKRIYQELQRHGFPRPAPTALQFKSASYTLEEEQRAIAMDLRKSMRGTCSVTINHRDPASEQERHLIAVVLPELASAHNADPTNVREDRYSMYFFEGPEAEASAEAFTNAARDAVPARWHITPTALPDPT